MVAMPRSGVDGLVAPSLHAGIVEAMPDAVVVTDPEGRIVLTNPRAAEVFGWRDGELIGRPIEILMPPRYRARHPRLRRGYAGLRMNLLELRGYRKDRTEFPAEISLATIVEGSSTWVCATIRDITERKRSEERFRQLVDAAPDPLIITDADGTIVLASEQAQAVFGYTGDELVGEPIEVLVPTRYHATHRAMRQRFAADPRFRPMGAGRELYARHRDGSEIPVAISLAPLVTEDEVLLSASIRDLTERDRVQTQIDQVREDLVATVSHEMRTPLTSIIGYLELVLDSAEPLPPNARSMLEVVHQNAYRELGLVNDLLTVASAGTEGPSATVVDMGDVVAAAAAQARALAQDRGIELQVVADPGARAVRGRAHRLRQVVDNLVSNALKFTPEGGTVRVTCSDLDGRTTVTVEDTGVGIEPDELPMVFERLYRTRAAVDACAPGVGIGLSLVRSITQGHGGTVEVRSTPGTGTTVRVRLPYAAG
ncbi:PAS domain-containing sensor histidine kinase [Nocardioides zeae]|uniref:Sensor-like histidine kinase SenX3 n=1 Tax=Nocardioides zeae TaxID=1457234 RepID=A0A6P0HIR3_9ACTN|nr:PAS domain-containing sensor histidine kinase [Nocardioides zeae]NEN77525.1 PAS domain S-box protein [Nocardioides zeae]